MNSSKARRYVTGSIWRSHWEVMHWNRDPNLPPEQKDDCISHDDHTARALAEFVTHQRKLQLERQATAGGAPAFDHHSSPSIQSGKPVDTYGNAVKDVDHRSIHSTPDRSSISRHSNSHISFRPHSARNPHTRFPSSPPPPPPHVQSTGTDNPTLSGPYSYPLPTMMPSTPSSSSSSSFSQARSIPPSSRSSLRASTTGSERYDDVDADDDDDMDMIEDPSIEFEERPVLKHREVWVKTLIPEVVTERVPKQTLRTRPSSSTHTHIHARAYTHPHLYKNHMHTFSASIPQQGQVHSFINSLHPQHLQRPLKSSVNPQVSAQHSYLVCNPLQQRSSSSSSSPQLESCSINKSDSDPCLTSPPPLPQTLSVRPLSAMTSREHIKKKKKQKQQQEEAEHHIQQHAKTARAHVGHSHHRVYGEREAYDKEEEEEEEEEDKKHDPNGWKMRGGGHLPTHRNRVTRKQAVKPPYPHSHQSWTEWAAVKVKQYQLQMGQNKPRLL